jgi:hypothetical protein
MSVRRFDPPLNETQAWERSAAANPAAKSVAVLRDRQDAIRRCGGSDKDAAREEGKS